MASGTRTRYANAGGTEIAYQVLGEGPPDLLLFTGAIVPIECMDDDPSMARFQRRLTSFGRLIRFDPRGMGLSDRGSASSPPNYEQWVEDALAVLDDVGTQRAAVLAPYMSAAEGCALAALHPERVISLVIVNGAARFISGPDYPYGLGLRRLNSLMPGVAPDAVEQGVDLLAMIAPTVADDSTFRTWFDRAGNLGATPAMAEAHWTVVFTNDVRHLLPDIRVPALVLYRNDLAAPFLEVGHGRYLAEHIPGANYVELPGVDALYWVGDSGPMLDEIEEFVTGVRGGSGAERVLATVLFTDIVGSTDRASRIGDGRWRDLLDRHDRSVRVQIERFRGREVKTTGDGFVATFDSPGRAIECALAIRDSLEAVNIETRAGIHTGEIELRGADVAGMAVHIGARVSALAEPGEVLVSSTVKDLVTGSPVQFAARGEYSLKGVPGQWRVFAVVG